VANYGDPDHDRPGNTVTKLRASDGATLATFTVGSAPYGVAFEWGEHLGDERGEQQPIKAVPISAFHEAVGLACRGREIRDSPLVDRRGHLAPLAASTRSPRARESRGGTRRLARSGSPPLEPTRPARMRSPGRRPRRGRSETSPRPDWASRGRA